MITSQSTSRGTTTPVVLLDLNYTLVGNSKTTMWSRRYDLEVYRAWLVDLVKDLHVCLVTVRPSMFRDATLERIEAQTGWTPEESFFNDQGVDAATWKAGVLSKLLQSHRPNQMLAIESNTKVHRVYDSHGVPWCKVQGAEVWDSLPMF